MEIPVRNIYYLLSYAWNKLQEAERLEVSIGDYKDSLNLFTRLLVAAVNNLFKKGLDRSYIDVSKDYVGIKGKLNFKASLDKQLFKQGIANCNFDEFSSNVLQNRILKSTLRLITKLDAIDLRLKKDLWSCIYRFHGVDEIDLQLCHFQQVQIHRNNTEYDFPLRIALFIVENIVLDEQSDTYFFRDFTRDEKAMASLFEDFVRNFYAREQSYYQVCREDIRWEAIALHDSDLSLLPKMQTDISLESPSHKIIIDTKFYKETLSIHYDTQKFHSNNLYQIYSYLNNIEKDSRNFRNAMCDGMLLYPTTKKEIDASYKIGKHKIRIATVNLGDEWGGISRRLLGFLENSRNEIKFS